VVLRTGRRFGKSALPIAIGADEALRGARFSPLFKTVAPIFDALAFMLSPLIVSKNRGVGEIKLSTRGVIDIWSIETSPSLRAAGDICPCCSTRSRSARPTWAAVARLDLAAARPV